MAYSGTTAATSLSNPPVKFGSAGYLGRGPNTTAFTTSGRAGDGAKSVWLYNSSAGTSELLSSTYFTDAQVLGMKQGDIVISAGNTGSSAYISIGVLGLVSTAGAGIASSGGQISSSR